MKLMKKRERNVSVRKAAYYAVIINGLQILLILVVLFAVLIIPEIQATPKLLLTLTLVASLVVIWGAVVDIREALSTRKLLTQLDDMDDTIDAMANLNNTLRSQRHDFLNHLQVVYSLIEMEEYEEANEYIEKIYGRITAVSRVLKTANPAINALLQVKLAACEKAHVQVTLDITSKWERLEEYMPGWEMCKVLSNLIDNAIDAMSKLPARKRRLTITLTENLRRFSFAVANTGVMIPEDIRESLFQPGMTTKGSGHGMGLYIVKKTLNERGGDIILTSDAEKTEFSGYVPKNTLPATTEESAQKV
ncbi:MAG: Spo0B domain-containing protein [Clostridia bacterium]|nr:Spo0B domain-containing protein [Clostridia bacterium]